MTRWLLRAALSSGLRRTPVSSPRRVFADAASLSRRRYVDLLLVSSCLCCR